MRFEVDHFHRQGSCERLIPAAISITEARTTSANPTTLLETNPCLETPHLTRWRKETTDWALVPSQEPVLRIATPTIVETRAGNPLRILAAVSLSKALISTDRGRVGVINTLRGTTRAPRDHTEPVEVSQKACREVSTLCPVCGVCAFVLVPRHDIFFAPVRWFDLMLTFSFAVIIDLSSLLTDILSLHFLFPQIRDWGRIGTATLTVTTTATAT